VNGKGKVADPSNQDKTLAIVQKAEGPVDVKFVAQKLDVAWATARALLMNLLVERKIQAIQTRNGWLFGTSEKLQGAITA